MTRKEKAFWELYRILHQLLDAELTGDIDWREELELELEEIEEKL